LTGVSVRALHHYDRLGVLQPRRTRSRYRLYMARDIAVLEQIVPLQFISVSLPAIQRLLRPDRRALNAVLAAQRVVLEEKRRRLDFAIDAIRQAQAMDQPNEDQLTRIIEVITMQDQRKEWQQQIDALVQGKVDRLQALSPEARNQVRHQFAELAAKI